MSKNKIINYQKHLKERPSDEELDSIIREHLKQDADNTERDLHGDRSLDDIEVPEDMFQNIVDRLKEKGVWKEPQD